MLPGAAFQSISDLRGGTVKPCNHNILLWYGEGYPVRYHGINDQLRSSHVCYDINAKPPFPAERRGSATCSDLVLTAADGNRFSAFLARPENPRGANLIMLPDVRGLHLFYKDLAALFAEAGVGALAWDYFGRTAADQPRDETFEFWPHVQQMQPEAFDADLRSAIAAARHEFGDQPLFTLGFCMGGSLSLKAGVGATDLAGVVAFYSGLSRSFGALHIPVLEFASSITVPVLDLFGGADQGIPASDIEVFKERLSSAGVPHEIEVYEGAPHSFFDRRWAEHAAACADAWQRVLAFLDAAIPMA